MPESAPRRSELSVPEGVLVGWAGAAFLNSAMLLFPSISGGAALSSGARVALHLYDFGQTLALGVVIALAGAGLARWSSRPRWLAWALAAVVAAGLGVALLRDDLVGAAGRIASGRGATWVLYALSASVALLVPFSAWVAGKFARQRWRALPLSLGALASIANYFVLRGDYPGVHLVIGASAAVAMGAASKGASFPRVRALFFWGVAGCVAALAVFVPAPGALAAALGHSFSASLVPLLPRTLITKGLAGDETSGEVFRPGTDGGPTPPSEPPLVGPDAVIIYLSVDSMRADLLESPAVERFPNFRRLRDEGTWFSNARSPGTQTAVTLTSVMTGTYYSQQYWSMCTVAEGGGVRALFAHEDPHVRFPELLSRAGIPTVNYGQAVWLLNEYGLVRGFNEERFVKPVPGKPSTKGKWSTGDDVMALIEARLRKQGPGPLFLFFHDLDPHAPFDLGAKKKGATKELYLSEVALADARLGRLRSVLEQTGLAKRTIVVLTADHGEAFAEHGTGFHGQNLYDEQLRVPLVVYVPGSPPRHIDDAVTLMDLGPTFLDLLRQPTPREFMGQSLVPYLRGERPELTRPIIAEGRLKQSMLLPNGWKLIRNQREGTFEIYDLGKDPKETHNLYDELGPEGPKLMQRLRDFFEVHQIRRPGYEIPYRR